MATEPLASAAQYASAYPEGQLTTETVEASIAAAAITLSALMGGTQLSRCTYTLRPHRPTGGCWPHVDQRLSLASTRHSEDIALPSPVTEVLAVSVGGSPLDAADYRVWRGPTLMLSRVSGSWPASGNTGAATDMQVAVATGYAPDVLIQNAAIQIAHDLIESGVVERCGQDPHVIAKSAQGVSLQFQPGEGKDQQMGAVNRLLARHEASGGVRSDIYVPAIGGWEFGEEPSAEEPWTA